MLRYNKYVLHKYSKKEREKKIKRKRERERENYLNANEGI